MMCILIYRIDIPKVPEVSESRENGQRVLAFEIFYTLWRVYTGTSNIVNQIFRNITEMREPGNSLFPVLTCAD